MLMCWESHVDDKKKVLEKGKWAGLTSDVRARSLHGLLMARLALSGHSTSKPKTSVEKCSVFSMSCYFHRIPAVKDFVFAKKKEYVSWRKLSNNVIEETM
jgi:hypothetical protein